VVLNVDEMLEVTLTGGREAPARARMAVKGLNGSLAGLRESVYLLVSELVTNAVKHGGSGQAGAVRVRLNSSSRHVRVEVMDDGPGFEPVTGRRVDPVEEGFGLALLDQLADRWGVEVERGARVWFEIDRRATPDA
jgi:signal transduction histidine kinase